MIAYAEGLDWPARPSTLAVHNVITQLLPLATGSVHLLSLMSVLHLFDEPLTVLAEIRRVLAPGGIFFLRDWIRTSLKDYLEWCQTSGADDAVVSRQRGFRLFAMHNILSKDGELISGRCKSRVRILQLAH
jgi:SAM-dependent methyltransferase